MNPYYRFWGMPEYARIKRELRETVTSHSSAVKLLDRSVQAIYSMVGLSRSLSTENGENEVIKRLQVIDMARSILNSIAIDAEGESYDFKTLSFAGVREVIDSTCNMLSAVTNIPQTLLFGRSPAGQNSTGESDFESYYNFVERIQKLMLRANLTKLIDIIILIGSKIGKVDEKPDIKLTFNPLWSLSETEQTQIDQSKAAMQQTRAQTAQAYVDMGVLDPTEVRKALASSDDFVIEEILDDMDDEELWGEFNQQQEQEAIEGQAEPEQAEQGQGLPDTSGADNGQKPDSSDDDNSTTDKKWVEPGELERAKLFPPFAASLEMLDTTAFADSDYLTKDDKSVITNNVDIYNDDTIYTDADGECRAKDPSKCRIHGISRSEAAKDSILKGRKPETQKLYDKARKNEKKITSDLIKIADELDVKMVSLEYSV